MATSVQQSTSTGVPNQIQDYFSSEKRKRNRVNQGELNPQDTNVTSKTEAPRENTKQSKCEILGILTDRPKYRQYSTLDARVATFENWPDSKTQGIKELAEAGFAYTGVDDSVRCFYCSIGLRDWPQGACPWEQHIFASPKCAHVIQCKGQAFVKYILGDDLCDSDIDDSDDVIDTVQLAINRNKDAVAIAREFCTDEDLLKTAVKAIMKKDRHIKFTAVELVKTIDIIKENTEQSKALSEIYDDEEDDLDTDGNSDDEDDVEEIVEINRKLKDPITCKICFDAIACIITLPCGHLVSCSQCVPALSTCAVCRTPIKGTVRALMAI